MFQRKIIPVFFYFLLLSASGFCGDTPQYSTNPFTFSASGTLYRFGDHFFMVDLNGDGHLDFTYRSEYTLFAYDHYGTQLWYKDITVPQGCNGSTFAASDIDNDGQVEILALNRSSQIVIYNGLTGTVENTITVKMETEQRAGYIAVVNLRGAGDRDVIVQTVDVKFETEGQEFYVNRKLIALNMESTPVDTLWTVTQNRSFGDGIYEGYWGQAHGGLMCADVDGDGLDEVIGANLIDHDSNNVPLSFPTGWIDGVDTYLDHLDCIAVGDFRPGESGLEWVITNEDHVDTTDSEWFWNTSLLSPTTKLWSQETSLFSEGPDNNTREPQDVAVGNFDTSRPFSEVWVRSRLGDETTVQHPWMFDNDGVQFMHYEMDTTLPAGFNTSPLGNKRGVEEIWTIDWFGTSKDYIAATARGIEGHVGIFDAVTGDSIWTTMNRASSMQCKTLYVADVSGDSREELVIFDLSDNTIKVFWNGEENTNQPKPDKWDDPLYARIKQNWSYYSPGSYTYGDYPLISDIALSTITTSSVTIAWTTDEASDSQVEYGETTAYGSETAIDPTLNTSHSVEITGLDPNTGYHFRVKSNNTYSKLGMSADNTFQTKPVLLQVKVFLEGPYVVDGDSMTTRLKTGGYIPLTSPYSQDPREVVSIPANITDWVLVQLRTTYNGSAVISKSAFLHRDGRVVADDGTTGEITLDVDTDFYYIVLIHRNHLAVMSADSVELTYSGSTLYDFTGSLDQYFGSDAKVIDTSPNVYGMYAGDVNGNGVISLAAELTLLRADNLHFGYLGSDVNLNGVVSLASELTVTRANNLHLSKVPQE